MSPDMINSNVPAIRPGKISVSDLRVIEPATILTDEQIEQLWRRHPVTQEQIDAADAVGSADGLLWPICAMAFVLAVALSAVFS